MAVLNFRSDFIQSICGSLAAAAADFTFQWIASSDNAHHNAGFCNYDWPVRDLPSSLCLGLI
jgi:hypothetical protein